MSAKRKSILEMRMVQILNHHRFPDPVREYRFHPVRRWKFDFAYPDKKIAIECEGGIWTEGRHTRGTGFSADMEKYNAATVLGWKILRYSTQSLYAVENDLRELFNNHAMSQ